MKNLPPLQQTTYFLSPPDAQVKEQLITPAEPEHPRDSGETRAKLANGKNDYMMSIVPRKPHCGRAGKPFEAPVQMHTKGNEDPSRK